MFLTSVLVILCLGIVPKEMLSLKDGVSNIHEGVYYIIIGNREKLENKIKIQKPTFASQEST